jgi:hypothetical protein
MIKGVDLQHNKWLLILPVIAIVAASGCTMPSWLGGGGTTTGIGNGVTILEFAPDFSSVQSGDYVQLQVRAQNMGEVKAYNVKAELTGIDVSQWGGTFGYGFVTSDFGDMLPFDKETNTPGSIKTKQWRLTAPSQPKGINQNYQPIVKLSYDYKTSAQKMITIVDEAELRRILQNGGSLPGQTATYSSGPLTVTITTGAYEKTAAEQFNYDNLFPVQIKITRTGSGNVVPPGTGNGLYGGAYTSIFGDAMNYPVGIRITPPAGTSFRNLGGGWSGVDDCSTGTITKEMWKGQELDLTCELSVDTRPAYREDRPLQVDVYYRYQTEATTNLMVYGKDSSYSGGGWSGGLGYGW